MRTFIAFLLVPILKVTGYRFSKSHRHNNDLVYRLINTVKANQLAEGN